MLSANTILVPLTLVARVLLHAPGSEAWPTLPLGLCSFLIVPLPDHFLDSVAALLDPGAACHGMHDDDMEADRDGST